MRLEITGPQPNSNIFAVLFAEIPRAKLMAAHSFMYYEHMELNWLVG